MRPSPPLNRALVWFRRDLRDFDHAALSHALRDAREVYCAFVLDREILDALPSPADRRVEFIRESLLELDQALKARGGALIVRHAFARDAIPGVAATPAGAAGAVLDYPEGDILTFGPRIADSIALLVEDLAILVAGS